jgi:uncharacterized protein YeaO (DUF488 family)
MIGRKSGAAGFGALNLKRAYAAAEAGDGLRVLVDRLWPRGLSKQKARVDLWLKEIAPSHELRRRFHADPQHWPAFKAAYAEELAREPAASLVRTLRQKIEAGPVTLLFAARDEQHNNAAALCDWLIGRPPP